MEKKFDNTTEPQHDAKLPVSGSLTSLQTTLEMFYDFLYEREIAKQIGVGVDTVAKHFIDEKLSGNDR